MTKSQELLNNLIASGCDIRLCDEKKLQAIIREYFCQVHKEACEATRMACNKQKYNEPQFYDK